MSNPPMPVKLLIALLLLCLNVASNLYTLSGEGGAMEYVRIGFNLILLIGLVRGQEWARGLAKATAVLALLAAGILLVYLLPLGSLIFVLPELQIVFVMAGLALVYGVFLLWCMSQQDVQAWLASRSMRA
jgi:hypothetical protein